MIKTTFIPFIFMLLLGAFPIDALTQTIATDRPLQSATTSTVPKGKLQLETGINYSISGADDNNIALHNLALPNALLKLGVANFFELRFSTSFNRRRLSSEFGGFSNTQGFDDFKMGFKWRLTQPEEGRTQLSILSEVVAPTGTFSENVFGIKSALLVSKQINNNVSMLYNLGYNYFGEGNGDFTYTANIGIGLSDRLGFAVEAYGAYQNFETFSLNGNMGVTYLITNFFQIDYSFGVGITDRMNYHAVGLSICLPN